MKDAAGNTPQKRTAFEKKWAADIESGELQKRFDALQERLALPLKDKIALTNERIREWYEAWGGNVAVSYSGGIDSAVLLHLVRKLYPEVEAVFCNTGLEYPEILRLVKRTPNVRIMRPKKPFHHVIRDHGWPIASKKVSRGVDILRHPTDKNQNIWRLYDQGINRYGEAVAGYKVPNRWRFLVDAPFNCSDKCCGIMKKEPMRRYSKETGNMQFVGMMASGRQTISEERKRLCRELAAAGLTKKEIREKTGLAKSTVYYLLKGLESRAGKPGERRTANPNRQWQGRYCRKCRGKILGGNWWYCRACQSERVRKSSECESTDGQYLMAL